MVDVLWIAAMGLRLEVADACLTNTLSKSLNILLFIKINFNRYAIF